MSLNNWLVIATGPSVRKYENEIRSFSDGMTTIGVHHMAGRFVPDYHLFVSKKRYKKYGKYVSPQSTLVLTRGVGGEFEVENEYPSSIGRMEIDGGMVRCSGASGGVLAIAYAIINGADTVFVSGLDGYSTGAGHHYSEKNNSWERLMEHESATRSILQDLNGMVPVKIITPTVYEEYYAGFADIV